MGNIVNSATGNCYGVVPAIPKNSKPYVITVKTITGKSLNLLVTQSETIKEIKERIAKEIPVCFKRHTLIYLDTPLDDEMTLKESGIFQMGDTLHIMLDLKLQGKVGPISLTNMTNKNRLNRNLSKTI